MAAPDITLNAGFVLLSPSSTMLGIEALDNVPVGKLEKVPTGYTDFAVNDILFYKDSNAMYLKYTDEDYIILPAEDLYFKENTPP